MPKCHKLFVQATLIPNLTEICHIMKHTDYDDLPTTTLFYVLCATTAQEAIFNTILTFKP